jgi:hypothetical protein
MNLTMDHFYNGFYDELSKLAGLDPRMQAWAISRAITSGVSAGLMGGMTLAMAQRGTDKKKKHSVLVGALPAAAIGTLTGLGKGIFEFGIENKVLKALTKVK